MTHCIYCLPFLQQKEQDWCLHVLVHTACSGQAYIRETPTFLPSYQRASLRQCTSQRCPVLVLTVVLDVLWSSQMRCVCSFLAEKSIIRLELPPEYMSALKASSRKCLWYGWDIYFLHGSYLNVHSHNASDCRAMLVFLSVTNTLTQSQKCSLHGVDVQYLYIGYRSEDIYFKSWFFFLIVFLCL